MTPSPEPQPTSFFAAFLSYLVPGLGQMYQGRFSKGLLFFVCLLSLFHVGHAMGHWQNVYVPTNNGGRGLERADGMWGEQRAEAQNRGGNVFVGLVNRWHYPGQFWIGISAWPALWQFYGLPLPDVDKYPVLAKYQREPNERDEVNPFIVDSDKTPDLGLMYTVIAGVLNILVIYDAYAGPAFPPTHRPKPPPDDKEPKPPTTEPPVP